MAKKDPGSLRGFARMDPKKHREVAVNGGKNVPAEKRSFSQNKDLAAEAGRKGGLMLEPQKRSWSQDRKLASDAARKPSREAKQRAGRLGQLAQQAARERRNK